MSGERMQYLLAGFTQSTGIRAFAFEGVTSDWVRRAYSVSANLALARRYGIQMQELPLLCRGVLEQRSEGDERRAFTFTEGDMTIHSDSVRVALALHKKKGPRRAFAAVATASAAAAPPT